MSHEAEPIPAWLEPDRSPTQTSFIAGTLVWTESGLRPIEEIRTGDRVWSKPEDGEGGPAYKRVTQVFKRTAQLVYLLRYHTEGQDDDLFVMGNQPVWCVGQGWTRARFLDGGEEILLAAGNQGWIMREVVPVYGSREDPEVGWFYDPMRECSIFVRGPQQEDRPGLFDQPPVNYLPDVHHLEVEDFHTYFVDPAGVWVGDRCLGGGTAAPPRTR